MQGEVEKEGAGDVDNLFPRCACSINIIVWAHCDELHAILCCYDCPSALAPSATAIVSDTVATVATVIAGQNAMQSSFTDCALVTVTIKNCSAVYRMLHLIPRFLGNVLTCTGWVPELCKFSF